MRGSKRVSFLHTAVCVTTEIASNLLFHFKFFQSKEVGWSNMQKTLQYHHLFCLYVMSKFFLLTEFLSSP